MAKNFEKNYTFTPSTTSTKSDSKKRDLTQFWEDQQNYLKKKEEKKQRVSE